MFGKSINTELVKFGCVSLLIFLCVAGGIACACVTDCMDMCLYGSYLYMMIFQVMGFEYLVFEVHSCAVFAL